MSLGFLDFRQQRLIGIDAHHCRPTGQRREDDLLFFSNFLLRDDRLARYHEKDLERKVECFAGLRLLDADTGLFGIRLVVRGYVQDWVARTLRPIVEEALQAAAGDSL